MGTGTRGRGHSVSIPRPGAKGTATCGSPGGCFPRVGARRGAGRQQSHPGGDGTRGHPMPSGAPAPRLLHWLPARSVPAAEGTAALTKAPRWQDVSFIPAAGETGTFAPSSFILPRGTARSGEPRRLTLAEGMRRGRLFISGFHLHPKGKHHGEAKLVLSISPPCSVLTGAGGGKAAAGSSATSPHPLPPKSAPRCHPRVPPSPPRRHPRHLPSLARTGLTNKTLGEGRERRGGDRDGCQRGVSPPLFFPAPLSPPARSAPVLPATLLQLSQALKNNNQCGKTTTQREKFQAAKTNTAIKGAGDPRAARRAIKQFSAVRR